MSDNADLTPYDTGARLEPKVWLTPSHDTAARPDPDRYGRVDFDDDEGATIATVHIERNADGTYVLRVGNFDPAGLSVVMDGCVSDSDAIDMIALGLGTKSEWNGADELEWIADTVGLVRNHPGDMDPENYLREFEALRGVNLMDTRLSRYISDEALGEGAYDE